MSDDFLSDDAFNQRYPIGYYIPAGEMTEGIIKTNITRLENIPAALNKAVAGLTAAQLDTPYRNGGWTLRQVVHHIADAHMNAYIRFKLALTETEPLVKTFEEVAWAEMSDAKTAPVELSLTLVESLHIRWVMVLKSLSPADFQREFIHPDLGQVPLERALELYAWHGDHHLAHITSTQKK